MDSSGRNGTVKPPSSWSRRSVSSRRLNHPPLKRTVPSSRQKSDPSCRTVLSGKKCIHCPVPSRKIVFAIPARRQTSYLASRPAVKNSVTVSSRQQNFPLPSRPAVIVIPVSLRCRDRHFCPMSVVVDSSRVTTIMFEITNTVQYVRIAPWDYEIAAPQ